MQILRTLLGRVRQCFSSFPDPRRGQNVVYSMADIGLAAFSGFLHAEPVLSRASAPAEEGARAIEPRALFEMAKIPSNNHIRAMLDPARPALLHPAFNAVVDELRKPGALDDFRRLGGHTLTARDGTEYF